LQCGSGERPTAENRLPSPPAVVLFEQRGDVLLHHLLDHVERVHELAEDEDPSLAQHVEVCERQADHAIAVAHMHVQVEHRGDTVAVGACGAIPYISGLVTYDTLGLNDKHIARQPVKYPGRAAFGHEKGDGVYIGSKRPTYLIPLPAPTEQPSPSYVGFSVSFSELTALPEVRSLYEFKSVQLDSGLYFNYFELMPGR